MHACELALAEAVAVRQSVEYEQIMAEKEIKRREREADEENPTGPESFKKWTVYLVD